MKPICLDCKRMFRPANTGVHFTEGMPRVEKPSRSPADWQPYRIWAGDVWSCPECRRTIIVGVGSSPVAERFQEDFSRKTLLHDAHRIVINDC